MEPTVLVVEDEKIVAELLRDYLQANGFKCHIIDNGLEVITWVRRNSPALILLDIMLPGKDGVTLCKEIRTFSKVPIIMTTARIEELDRLLGLELGADDYVCKPYSPREVVARVKAVLRRASGALDDFTDQIEFDEAGSRVLLHGNDLKLTAVEFYLFATLYSQQGRIFSRDQLMETIYKDHRIVNDRTVDSHIKKLRMKIARIKPGVELIHSVYGLGYKFDI
jgi:two-component system response regulator BaeR